MEGSGARSILVGVFLAACIFGVTDSVLYTTCKGGPFTRSCSNSISKYCCSSNYYSSASCCGLGVATCVNKYAINSRTTCYTSTKSYCCHKTLSSSSCCVYNSYLYYSSRSASSYSASVNAIGSTTYIIGYIVGGVIGGIIFLILIIVIPVVVCGACAASGSNRYNRTHGARVMVHSHNQVSPPPQPQYNQYNQHPPAGPPPVYSPPPAYSPPQQQGYPQQQAYPPPPAQYPPPQHQDPAYPPQ